MIDFRWFHFKLFGVQAKKKTNGKEAQTLCDDQMSDENRKSDTLKVTESGIF